MNDKKITPEELVTAAESYDQIYSERWMTSSDELIAASEFYDQIYSGFTHLTAQDLTDYQLDVDEAIEL